jgi:hypothetical protein
MTRQTNLVATPFKIARHILGGVLVLHTNGGAAAPDQIEQSIRDAIRTDMLAQARETLDGDIANIVARTLQAAGEPLVEEHDDADQGDIDAFIDRMRAASHADTAVEQATLPTSPAQLTAAVEAATRQAFEHRVAQALSQHNGYTVALTGRPADVPIPFTLADVAAIVVGQTHERFEDDCLLHPMAVQFVLKNGCRYDLSFDEDQDDLATTPGAILKTVPAFPTYDPTNIWHRILGPSVSTYVACRLITGATDSDIALDVGQEVVAIAKIRTAFAPFIDARAAMSDEWPSDFVAAVCEPRDGAILCHRFGAFPAADNNVERDRTEAACT